MREDEVRGGPAATHHQPIRFCTVRQVRSDRTVAGSSATVRFPARVFGAPSTTLPAANVRWLVIVTVSASRAAYYATHARACVACGSTEDVILHHRHYRDEPGRESDAALVVLCRRHHAKVHQRAGVFDLAVVTDLIIARSRRRWSGCVRCRRGGPVWAEKRPLRCLRSDGIGAKWYLDAGVSRGSK